jgi:putative CocE/NonD family hydrolase
MVAGIIALLLTACASSIDHPRTAEQKDCRYTIDISMRDGVRLHTVILLPAEVSSRTTHLPILLTRTIYGADDISRQMDDRSGSSPFDGWGKRLVGGPYIRVLQDVRGQNRSEGEFVVTGPLAHTANNHTATDESTDAYDTIDWLVHHVAETDGRVGLIGTSYDGFTTLMGLIDAHPAVKVAVAVNPMGDGWRGDDWFHNGAFRQLLIPQIGADGKHADISLPTTVSGQAQLFLHEGSAGAFGHRHGIDDVVFWREILAHPAYDSYWRARALDRVLAAHPPHVPLMLVHGLWDQEDIYGGLAVWNALRPQGRRADTTFLTIGPWRHAQALEDGSAVGALQWGQDTAACWRQDVLMPFLAHYLKGVPMDVAPVTVFRSGSGQWFGLPDWPPATETRPLYLLPEHRLAFSAGPKRMQTLEYRSDPAHPVPFMPDAGGVVSDETWLAADQRFVTGRDDVLTFTSDVLTHPLTVEGTPVAHLGASTSGTDADWVVKLIDAYPVDSQQEPGLSGALMPVAMDIFRGRYRKSLEKPEPLRSGMLQSYRIALPEVSHTFQAGHRIVVQIQSSWFPLYDRNPQRYVGNIFLAHPADYRVARQRIAVGGPLQSHVDLPVVNDGGVLPSPSHP